MENGRRTSITTDVIQYVVACGMKWPDVQPLMEFTRLAERKQGYYLSDRRIDGSLQSLIFHESAAACVVGYEPQVIPGLLQAPDYARVLVTAVQSDIGADRVAAAVRTRMERRRILSPPDRARFTFYIHEQALRFQVGSDAAMHEQMLADVALDEGQSRELAAELADEYDRGSHRVVADVLAQEQSQRGRGNELRGSGVVDPTPIYE